ncbi:sigma-70 family RNA polymerase sigma factor [Singulisphaera sp. PoT]|uniref:sigma-70 family RNA polymerase sigma factor n=1 Tax=Singulisphaera sp. PoT TaxID=3411797 RepID=UPI003BF5C4F2
MWPNADETLTLLKHVESEGAPAAERLWERHREPLRRLIGARLDPMLARRLDASDVVQEVLLKANLRLSDYLRKPAMPFQLWLRQIAHDHVIDEHRRHRVAARRSLDRERSLTLAAYADRSSIELAAQLHDPNLTPAATALRHELERRFHDALEQLDEPDREVLLMRHFEQIPNGEVARLLGLSEAAAGMRHLRALRKLRQILGENASGVLRP